jgi:hypothetical protein
LILVSNFSPVSRTLVSDAFYSLKSFNSINDSAEEFLTGVNDTGNAYFASVNNTAISDFAMLMTLTEPVRC